MLVGVFGGGQQQALHLPLCDGHGARGRFLAETYKPRLPKASIGKSCIRFKRLGDVDQDVLERLLRRVAELGAPTAPDIRLTDPGQAGVR